MGEQLQGKYGLFRPVAFHQTEGHASDRCDAGRGDNDRMAPRKFLAAGIEHKQRREDRQTQPKAAYKVDSLEFIPATLVATILKALLGYVELPLDKQDGEEDRGALREERPSPWLANRCACPFRLHPYHRHPIVDARKPPITPPQLRPTVCTTLT